jgi:xylose isomerase
MSESLFAQVPPIRYEGPETENPLAYRWYDRSRMVLGRTMEEHLRMAVCYWHTFCWDDFDVFGRGTFERP